MQTLESLEQARKLMLEAHDWSPWQWLNEKQRVREAANRANRALDDAAEDAKRSWHEQLRQAYLQLQATPSEMDHTIGASMRGTAANLKQAEDAACAARRRAEFAFSEAERNLDVTKARDGTRLALEAWNLQEKVIEEFEAVAQIKQED